MAKIYIGNMPFGRGGAQTVPGTVPTRKVFEGQLNEGKPSSVFPKDLRQRLDKGLEVALSDVSKASEGDEVF